MTAKGSSIEENADVPASMLTTNQPHFIGDSKALDMLIKPK